MKAKNFELHMFRERETMAMSEELRFSQREGPGGKTVFPGGSQLESPESVFAMYTKDLLPLMPSEERVLCNLSSRVPGIM